ncbi:hypothetical protein U3516DRAFT_530840 [Neocallimastix sp. 'constans']
MKQKSSLSSSDSIPRKSISSNESRISSSQRPPFTTSMSKRSSFNSGISNKKPFLYSYSANKIESKPLFLNSRSTNKIDSRPLLNRSSNSYEALKQKIFKEIGENQKSKLAKKNSNDMSISKYIESKGHSDIQPSSVQNVNKPALITPSSSFIYEATRKNSKIPILSKYNLSRKNSKLEDKITQSDNNINIKKSRIPITPTSKIALSKIDDRITNSYNTQNKILIN